MSRDISHILANFGVICPAIKTAHLQLDSRAVCDGDVFIAIKGHVANGEDFIASAFANGAKLALVEKQNATSFADMPGTVIGVECLSERIAEIAAMYYGSPSEKSCVFGVTGTNGKSTTTAMIAALSSACNSPGAVVGTLGYGHPDELIPLNNTTPAHVDLQRILAQLVDDFPVIAMEVSSHGLVQGRTAATHFDAAVFTNLSRDHLDYHGDMQSYSDAKLQLFTDCKPRHCIINIDDSFAQQWLEKHEFNGLVVYGQKPAQSNFEHFVWFDNVVCLPEGIQADLITSWGNATVTTPLYGLFNIYNLAAAMACLLSQKYSFTDLCQAVSQLQPVAGRMQAFTQVHKPTCIVDYAHTPDALALALQALQQHVPGKVTCVFGCGGDRDKGKRSLMAQAAEQYADKLVITSDNPRSEDPQSIIDDIKAGLSQTEYAYCDTDRARAIKYAIETSDPNGVVLIAGKGHEDYQIIGEQRLSFCDRKWVQTILQGETA